MAPKRSAVVDVLARKGYYDEMTNTFEEINEKRDIVEKELQELVEEREELVKAIAELQARLEQIGVSNKANCKALRKTERILRQLEQGGAVARAALRKLLLSRMTLEERVAKVREDFQLSCNWPASPVSRQRLKKEDLTMTRTEEDGSEVVLPMRSYCATGIEKPPVIVYFHGESYVAGTLDTHDWLCSALAQLSQAAVLSVEYRRPPEVRFPVPVDDAWAALQWAAAGSLGWPAPALAVAGDAAGGALAMACALRARAASERGEEEVPDLRVQVLFYPWVDVRPNSDSMQSCQEDNDLHILMQEDLAFASEIYGPPRVKSSEEEEEEEEDDEPKVEEWMKVEEASPLLAGTLQNLPRTFLAYAADDLLAPDCRALVSRLRKEQGAEAVHELELPGPLGPGFAKDPTKAASYAALAAAGAFASGAFMGRS